MGGVEETITRLAREVEERRYGKFRGLVTDNNDPQKRGRLRLRIPSVLGDQESDWALPCLPYGGASACGLFLAPPNGAQVWVEFEEGDVHRPVWTGTFWQDGSDVPPDAAKGPPSTVLLQTPGGHIIDLEDKSGDEHIRLKHSGGATVVIDKNGSIVLTDAKGATATLDADGGSVKVADANGNSVLLDSNGIALKDANGNKIEMAAAGVTIKAQQIVLDASAVMLGGQGGEQIIKGSTFLSLFATHMHPSSMGPTGPAIPQGEMSSLSSKVLTG